jgi:hypothetical protein
MISGRMKMVFALIPLLLAGTGMVGYRMEHSGPAMAGKPAGASTHGQGLLPDTLRKLPNVAFTGGEYLRFDVKYGFVTAGEARMIVSDRKSFV